MFVFFLLSSIYDDILIGLVNFDFVEQVGREHLHHVFPDVNSHVLSSAKWTEGDK